MNICIVEDDLALLENLRLLLDGEHDMTINGVYKNAEEALKSAPWKKTDVLLVDLELPAMSGIDLIRRVHPAHPDIRIFVYTIHEDRPRVLDAIKAGACGYLVKGVRPSQLIEALHEIFEGGAPMSPSIARAVLAELQAQASEPKEPNRGETLSMRERAILRHLERGLAYKEIADHLSIAPSTVHTHIKNIYAKLQARDKLDAIRKGRYRNFI